MDQQSVAPAVIERPPMRVGNVIGWFVLLVGATAIAQQGALRDLNGLLVATVTVAILYALGAIGGLIYYRLRGRPFSHFAGLATASVCVGLLLLGAASRNPISQTAGPGVDASASLEAEWSAAYTRFFEDPAKQYLLGPAIKSVFDEKALADANAGVPFRQALDNAQAHANERLDAVVHPLYYAQLLREPQYARLKLPGFERRHRQRIRELLAAGSEPMAALVQGADQVIAEIDQLN